MLFCRAGLYSAGPVLSGLTLGMPAGLWGHFGSATALLTGYCVLQFAQFDKTLVV